MRDFRILGGDVIERLRSLPSDSVHCVVTSPPYWGLRDYKIEPSVWCGDPDCAHVWGNEQFQSHAPNTQGATGQRADRRNVGEQAMQARSMGCWCQRCGAWRGCLGLEPTPGLFVQHMVEVFREVRRVLRPDGTLWLNLGDSYVTHPHGDGPTTDPKYPAGRDRSEANLANRKTPLDTGLKSKDLCMMPFRVALALQADAWYLRSVIPWLKRNGMPESTTDRPTSMVEYIFLLSKSESYFYDREAVRIASGTATHPGASGMSGGRQRAALKADTRYVGVIGPKDHNTKSSRHAAYQPTSRARRNTDWMFASIQDFYDHAYLQGLQDGKACITVSSRPTIENGASFPVQTVHERHESREESATDAPIHQEPQCETTPTPVPIEPAGEGCGYETLPEAQGPVSASSPCLQREQNGQSFAPEVQTKCGRKNSDGQGERAVPVEPEGQHPAVSTGMERSAGSLQSTLRLLPQDGTPHDGSRHPSDQRRSPHSRQRGASMPELQFPQTQPESSGLDAEDRAGLETFRGNPLDTFQGLLVDDAGDPLAMLVNPQPFAIEMCENCSTCYEARDYRKLAKDEATGRRVCGCGAQSWVSHFATFPERMVTPCILAGTSERGCCPECGAPWERIVEKPNLGDLHPDPEKKANGVHRLAHLERENRLESKATPEGSQFSTMRMDVNTRGARTAGGEHDNPFPSPRTIGWRPTCSHPLFTGEPIPCTVLDPFAGSGRTGLAAMKVGRSFEGVELNPRYIRMANWQAERRLAGSDATASEVHV